MVDHVEAVRGGPAQVLSNGQVASPSTFSKDRNGRFSRRGRDRHHRLRQEALRRTVLRPDGREHLFSVGGFYQNGDNVRRLNFASKSVDSSPKHLAQVRPGSILVWGRFLQEDNTWNLPLDIVDNGAVKEFSRLQHSHRSIGSPQERELTLRSGDAFRFDKGSRDRHQKWRLHLQL